MMQEIFILGSSGFAKEVFFLINEINKKNPSFEVKGFIDLNPVNNEIKIGSRIIPVFNENDFLGKAESKYNLALGMGNPNVLANIRTKYIDKFEFPNLIHPNVNGYFETISLGKGNVITSGCVFTIDIHIGDLNLFNLNVTLGHDSRIGNCNVFNPGVNLSGGVEFGSKNLFGTNASVLQYVKVGDGNTIGAGAMINKEVMSNSTVVGVPGKVIKQL